jgi:hypothetical protein
MLKYNHLFQTHHYICVIIKHNNRNVLIPTLESNGNLPPGIHWSTIEDIEDKLCFSEKRAKLLDGFKLALESLKKAGCKHVYIDGSFTTSKLEPGDIDVCWDTDGVDLNFLNTIEPTLLIFDPGRKTQKDKFGCEFFPADSIAKPPFTIFLDFFQEDREGNTKGIIGLKL